MKKTKQNHTCPSFAFIARDIADEQQADAKTSVTPSDKKKKGTKRTHLFGTVWLLLHMQINATFIVHALKIFFFFQQWRI